MNPFDVSPDACNDRPCLCKEKVMVWSKPTYVVISLGAEINSYVAAQLSK